MTGRLARTRTWLRRHIDNWSQTVSPHESDDPGAIVYTEGEGEKQ